MSGTGMMIWSIVVCAVSTALTIVNLRNIRRARKNCRRIVDEIERPGDR
jgi:hypothetical protein